MIALSYGMSGVAGHGSDVTALRVPRSAHSKTLRRVSKWHRPCFCCYEIEEYVVGMAFQKQDRIQKLADSLKGSLDGGVDAVADKIRTAQVFADEQSDALDKKNNALKGKLAEFLNSAKKTGDDLHDGINERLTSWIAEIDKSS